MIMEYSGRKSRGTRTPRDAWCSITVPRFPVALIATAVLASACLPERRPATDVLVASSCTPLADARTSEVRIVRTAAPAEQAILDRWCAGVGPGITRPGPAGSEAPSSPDSLVVVTWNTNVGGGDLAGFVEDLRRGALTGGTPVRHFVLLLQEVYRAGVDVPRTPGAARPQRIAMLPTRGARTDVVTTAEALGLHLFYVPSMANGWENDSTPAEDRGNAILSSLPLRDLTAIELPHEGQRRVAVSATVEGTSVHGERWALRLVNVHLDNRATGRRVLRSLGLGRARQAHALARLFADDVPTVLGGDLNTWGPARLEGAVPLLRTHFPLGNAILQPTFAARFGIGARRLDHLMFRLPHGAAVTTQRLDAPRGSDHYPLLSRLRWPAPLTVTTGPVPATPDPS
jgi:endonuclease/exonuclease/phosphatase family metal-dependent hydrolase